MADSLRVVYDCPLEFAVTARDEMDLDALTRELARVVQETFQPVGVWLKPPGRERGAPDRDKGAFQIEGKSGG